MILIIPFLVVITNITFAQQKSGSISWHLTIVDSITAKGIEKATVVVNKKQYYSSNESGEIVLNKITIRPKDTINISCVGYKSVTFVSRTNSKFPDTVRLSALIRRLDEVKIGVPRPTKMIMGTVRKSYNTHRITNPDEQYAEYIPNEKKTKGIITSIQYVVNDKLHGIEKPFKVDLYTKNKGNPFPDQELIKDGIIVYNPQKKTHISVDVSKYNIQLPEDGIVVVFETLSSSDYGNESIWYEGQSHFKMPGIDMELKHKDDYSANMSDKEDRKTQYSMVLDAKSKLNFGQLVAHSFLYDDGNDFAITISITP